MVAYLRLLARVAATAARRSLAGWPVALSVFLYAAILVAAGMLFGRLGLAGGFILGFVEAACVSGYLYLLSVVVSGSRLAWGDVRDGFLALLWDVIGVVFFLWLASFGVEALIRMAGPHGEAVGAGWGLIVAIFLNPIPELIYQRRAPGRTVDRLVASARFVQDHWIEWFVPNLLFGVALLGLVFGAGAYQARFLIIALPSLFSLEGAFQLAPALLGRGDALWVAPLVLALCHYAMVFRGLLFQEIARGGWRARALRDAWR